MYAWQVVEEAPTSELFPQPLHPYSEGLLKATPRAEQVGDKLPTMPGSVPPPTAWPTSCRFQNRCPYVIDACRQQPIPLERPLPGRQSRCIRIDVLRKEQS